MALPLTAFSADKCRLDVERYRKVEEEDKNEKEDARNAKHNIIMRRSERRHPISLRHRSQLDDDDSVIADERPSLSQLATRTSSAATSVHRRDTSSGFTLLQFSIGLKDLFVR